MIDQGKSASERALHLQEQRIVNLEEKNTSLENTQLRAELKKKGTIN